MTLGDPPPTVPSSVATVSMPMHFVPYGSYDSLCGGMSVGDFSVDERDATTCVACLQVLLNKTEANVIHLIEKHLEECLSEPISKGWKQQIADSLIRSFEIGEEYGKQVGWDEGWKTGADDQKAFSSASEKFEITNNPYRKELTE